MNSLKVTAGLGQNDPIFKLFLHVIIFSLVGIVACILIILGYNNIHEFYPWKSQGNVCMESLDLEMNVSITVFTIFKDTDDNSTDSESHSLVIKNWASLRPNLRPVLFTSSISSKMATLALQHKWDVLPIPKTNKAGHPFIKRLYLRAYKEYNSDFYAYIDEHCLFGTSLFHTLSAIQDYLEDLTKPQGGQLFLAGRTYDYELDGKENISSIWPPQNVHNLTLNKAKNYSVSGVDYFITTKEGFPWKHVPDLVIGGSDYNEYLLLMARYWKLTTFDITHTHRLLHMNQSKPVKKSHDGSHGKLKNQSQSQEDNSNVKAWETNYNQKILRLVHPEGIPWTEAQITLTMAFSIPAPTNHSVIMVCGKPNYQGIRESIHFAGSGF